MPLYFLLLFALVQGVTEFLPVSSSGHLQLFWAFLGKAHAVSGFTRLGLEIAAHGGTLLAVLLYCRRDLTEMLVASARAMRRRRMNLPCRLMLLLLLATLPLVATGWFLRDLVADTTRGSLLALAWATLVFALLLWFADRMFLRVRRLEHLRAWDALIVGIFQVFALVPGVSRAGIVITAARFLSCERSDAARLSLLLSIPAIIGALGAAVLESERLIADLDALLLVGTVSCAVALPCMAFLLRWVRRRGYGLFVGYRLIFAGALFAFVFAVPYF